MSDVKRLNFFDHFGLAGSATAFFTARLALHNTTQTMNILETLLTYAFIWLCIKLPGKTFVGGIPKYVIGPTVVSVVVSFILSKVFGTRVLYPFMGIISVTPLLVGIIGASFGIVTFSKNKIARSLSVFLVLVAMMFEYAATANVTEGSLELRILGNPDNNTISLIFAEVWLAQVFAYQALMVICRFPVRLKNAEQQHHSEDLAA